MKLKTKLTLVVVLITFSAILIFFFAEYYFLKKDLQYNAYKDLQNVAFSMEKQISSFEDRTIYSLKTLIEGSLIEPSTQSRESSKFTYSTGKEMVRVFYYAHSELFRYIYVLNKELQVNYAFVDGFELHPHKIKALDESINKPGLKQLYLDECIIQNFDGDIINYACKSRDTHSVENKARGYVVFGIDLNHITKMLMNAHPEFSVFDLKNGDGLVYFLRSEKDYRVLSTNANLSASIPKLPLDAKSSEYKLDDYYVIQMPTYALDGTIISILAPVNKYRPIARSLYLRLTLIVLLSCLVSLIVGRYFTEDVYKPFEKLFDFILEIKKGVYDKPISIEGNDEVAEFASAIEEMRKSVVENQKILKLNSEMVAIGQTTAIVAHDVRKPLTNMKALLAMLPTIKDSPEKISLMQKNVEESINQTNTLLNEILEFSKDSTSLDRQNYSLQKIIQASLSNSVNNCEDVDLAVDYDLKHSNQVFVDYDKIVRVLANIFDNSLEAIRLMNGDGPNVQLRVSSFDVSHDDKKFISLSILDNGPGISPEIIDKIFNVYFTYNKKGGTGLGLAICKRIVNLHGGKIFAHNNPSGGVRVIIELPVGTRKEKIIEEDLMRSYRRQSVRPLKNEYPRFGILDSGKKDEGNLKKLLIADDEDIVRESIKVAIGNHPDLKQQIYILEVDSAEKALHILKNERCDCLITDIDFGRNKMNGYELVEKVLTKYSDIDVLIHSNKCQGEFDRRIDEINSKKFKGCVPKLMKRSYLTDFLLNQESANKSKQNVLIINDDDAVLVSLGILFKASGCEVAHAGNSNKAVELFEKNNFDLIVSDLKLECDTMNGYDILRHFRRTGDRTPFYIVSGSSKRTEEKIAIEYGADGYFQLPIDNGDIEKMLTYRT